uniref:Bac7.5 protein n=1 Tax=Capra hircus TaxID=9925 RepID=A0A8C2SE06_CAPHI
METQRAGLSLGRWSLCLLLLGLVLPSASARPFSYREAVLRAVDQFNERSAEANLYRLLELDPPPEQDAEDQGARKPVSFRVKETVCPRTSQQPVEQCDFRENGLVKQCVGTVTRYWIRGDFDITCNDLCWDGLVTLGSPLSPKGPWLAYLSVVWRFNHRLQTSYGRFRVWGYSAGCGTHSEESYQDQVLNSESPLECMRV